MVILIYAIFDESSQKVFFSIEYCLAPTWVLWTNKMLKTKSKRAHLLRIIKVKFDLFSTEKLSFDWTFLFKMFLLYFFIFIIQISTGKQDFPQLIYDQFRGELKELRSKVIGWIWQVPESILFVSQNLIKSFPKLYNPIKNMIL